MSSAPNPHEHAAIDPALIHEPGPPPPAGLLTPLAFAVVLAALLGVGYLWTHKAHAEAAEANTRAAALAQGPLVRVATVVQAPATRLVTLPGEVHAWEQATLYAKVSGYLKTIRVDRGDRVRKHQLLATLESPDADQQVSAARADLNQKRQLAQRSEALSKSGIVTQQELESAVANEQVAQSNLRRARALKQYEELRAPFAGVITARYADPGALLPAATSSTQSAQPVVDVADLSKVRIWAYLGQDDAAQVKVGDKARITFDPRPDDVRVAQVARVANALDPRTRTMLTELVLENRDGALYPGEFVHVQLTLTARPTAVIPSEALIVRGGKLMVAVIDEQHLAHLRPITVASDDGKTLQVSTGLQGGELVALNAAGDVVEGKPVRVAASVAAPVAR